MVAFPILLLHCPHTAAFLSHPSPVLSYGAVLLLFAYHVCPSMGMAQKWVKSGHFHQLIVLLHPESKKAELLCTGNQWEDFGVGGMRGEKRSMHWSCKEHPVNPAPFYAVSFIMEGMIITREGKTPENHHDKTFKWHWPLLSRHWVRHL